MTLFIQNDATGAGAGNLNPNQAAVDLAIIANGDTGLGLAAQIGNRQQVTYARTLTGPPPLRLDNLVSTNFTPNYGSGPQNVNIIILPVLANFTLNDGTSILTVGGTALSPMGSGLAGATLNSTNDCLVIYDTTQNNGKGYCTARDGTGGTLDLQTPNPIILYHELSHALRIVTNAQLGLTAVCNPSSPEENAAITDENDLRTQIANANSQTPVLRDPGNHCGAVCSGGSSGSCCIIASVASGSPLSQEVSALRLVRDNLLRKSEIGFYFFQAFFHDYYSFSPQVCILMAQDTTLRQFVRESFVQPLVNILSLIEQYAVGGVSAVTLGKQFVIAHADRSAAAATLNVLRQANEVLNGSDTKITNSQQELAQIIAPALVSRHLRWGIIEPIQLYTSALQSHVDQCGVEQLGDQLYEAISSWTAQIPLDSIWSSLAVPELQDELELLENTLLRTTAARASFRNRLKQKFGDRWEIAKVLNEKISKSGRD